MTIRADRNGVLNDVGTAVREGVHVVLAATKPTIAIISDGDGNTYGHPTEDCLERLHSVGTKTYWTEHGNGAEPTPGWDTVSGTAVVSVDLAAGQYTVAHGTTADTYAIGGGAVGQGTGTGRRGARHRHRVKRLVRVEQAFRHVPLQHVRLGS